MMEKCSGSIHQLPTRQCVLCGRVICPMCGEVLRYGRFTNDYMCKEHMKEFGSLRAALLKEDKP